LNNIKPPILIGGFYDKKIKKTDSNGKARKFSLGLFELGSGLQNIPRYYDLNFWAIELCSLKNSNQIP
jgi:hypothetical protein